MPSIQRMKEQAAGRDDLVFLAMNTGRDNAQVVADYWEDAGFTLTAVLDEAGRRGRNAQAMGLVASPTNIVVGPDGTVLYASVGFDERTIRKYLRL